MAQPGAVLVAALLAAVLAAAPTAGRALAQREDPYARLAPCNGDVDHTCTGAPGTDDICCDKANYR